MKATSQSSQARKAVTDPEITKKVGQEILDNQLDPGAWATAVSKSRGKRQEALAAYARIRIQQLSRCHRRLKAKERSFDTRRVTKCFGVKTVQDLLQRNRNGEELNFLKPRVSMFLLLTLGIGSAGCVGSLGRLLSGVLPQSMLSALPTVALVSGGLAIVGAVALRFVLPKRWIMLGWNSGLLMACAIACFASLLGGVKLISRAAPLSAAHQVVNPATPAPAQKKAASAVPDKSLVVSISRQVQ